MRIKELLNPAYRATIFHLESKICQVFVVGNHERIVHDRQSDFDSNKACREQEEHEKLKRPDRGDRHIISISETHFR